MASRFQFLPWLKPRKGARPAQHSGFYALYESPGSAWDERDDAAEDDPGELLYRSGRANVDYDAWDRRLDQVDDATSEELRKRQRWWQPAYWRGRRKLWWAGRITASILLLFILLVGWLAITAPLSKSLQPIAPAELTLLAADGTPIARNGSIIDKPVKVADLPAHVVEPFIAIEDRRFYSHWGVDPRGVARALWSNVTTGRTQGGSTITQQLAKFTFLTPEQNLGRKGREALIAFWLEAWLSKDEILERYLSNAYFGDNCYGLRAASLHYFYRQPENLRPEQAAMLAGLVQSPSRFAPTRHYDRAKKRMDLVKAAMVDVGYLSPAQAAAMPYPKVDSRTRNDLPTGTYFADWALPDARALTENSYARQTLTTTLDSRLQGIARRAVGSVPLGKAQVALVAMRPNGEVVAMIGGKDYGKSPFNRATQARRQPGSTFKLFVYLAAIEEGWRPDDRISNEPFTTGSYRPKNASGNYSPSLTLEEAFARSSNVAAVRLFEKVGDKAVIRTARSLGITSPLPEGDPSLALGTSSMSLLELTAAYAGVAANDFPVAPRAFPADRGGWFSGLFSGHDSLSGSEHEAIERLLRAAINKGTGRAAVLRTANFGKTGTSQDNRDALFVGYAGDLVVGVWVGNDDNSPLAGVHGGGLPARIWRNFMSEALGEAKLSRPSPPKVPTNPEGPVQPLDLPGSTIPLDDEGSKLKVDQDGLTVSTDIQGAPLDIRIDNNGVAVRPGPTPSPTAQPPPG
ncbi:MAG: transglycosylase domain-containing protein [Sphingomonadales bacterium]|nr:transglycosylase domain-containing protein [Sphingomonadales bacterium]MBD3773435.1 transglycosylase domain-containing protein [Paracoccaceae bacterium]